MSTPTAHDAHISEVEFAAWLGVACGDDEAYDPDVSGWPEGVEPILLPTGSGLPATC